MTRPRHPASWTRPIALIGLLALLYTIYHSLDIPYRDLGPQQIRDKIVSFGIWAPIVYIIFYTLRVFILFPASLFSIAGGLAFGPLLGTVYTLIGATGCAVIEFFFARFVGRKRVAQLIHGRIAKIDHGIERHGFATVLWIRLIPNVAYDIQNVSLGLTNVRLRDYVLATVIGMIPGAFAISTLGDSLTDLRRFWKVLLAILLIVGVIGLGRFRHRRKG